MANAKQLPSGKWRVLVYEGLDENNKKKYKSITRDKKRDAERAAQEYEVLERNFCAPSITLGEAADRYIESKSNVLSPSTLRGYKSLRKNFMPAIVDLPIVNITQEMIQREINKLAAEKSPKYVRNVHGFLSAVYREYNPDFALRTTLPQKRPYEPAIPDAEQIKVILEVTKDTDIELPILLALWMGMRMSEIKGLRWDCIQGDVIAIKQAMVVGDQGEVVKGTKSLAGNRKLKAPAYIMNLINAQPHDSEYIITRTRDYITSNFTRVCKENHLPHFRFHDLRHANASVMLALGVPDKYAMERMGHATNSILKTVYQHTMTQEMEKVNARIDGYFETLVENETT